MAKAKEKKASPPDVAEQLRRAVAGCGLSLNGLARETGVSAGQLSRFLRGERTLTLKAAARLCAYLKLSLAGPELDEKE
jgi:transcriptional regulator with XRE-family HTH domain